MTRLVSGQKDQAPKCRLLSLSGGGSKGAYEVGAMQQIVDQLPASESQYDVISGVSVGAINALGFSLHPKGEEKQMAEFMSGLWKNLTNSDIWRMWPDSGWDPIYGITSKTGYLDNTPLKNLLINLLETHDGIQKKVIASATDILNGVYRSYRLHEFDQSNHEMIASAIVGSAAMPFVFPPMNMSKFGYDDYLMDGGTTWNNNMVTGVEECLKMKGIESTSQIELDIISLNSVEVGNFTDAPTFDSTPQTIKNYFRKRDIRGFYTGLNDIIEFMQAYPNISFRYFIKPEKSLMHQYQILDFDFEHTKPVYDQGTKDAKRVIEMGPGKSFDNLVDQEKIM